MPKGRDYHIVPSPRGGWTIRREGTDRASGVFARKSDAMERGRQLARGANAELVVHGSDGRIRNRDNNRRDPIPPRERPPTRSVTPKGFGSLRGMITVRKDIDLTKPIYEQATRATRKYPDSGRKK
jgi:hypothetical protein